MIQHVKDICTRDQRDNRRWNNRSFDSNVFIWKKLGYKLVCFQVKSDLFSFGETQKRKSNLYPTEINCSWQFLHKSCLEWIYSIHSYILT